LKKTTRLGSQEWLALQTMLSKPRPRETSSRALVREIVLQFTCVLC
jgi:hypothetical protein